MLCHSEFRMLCALVLTRLAEKCSSWIQVLEAEAAGMIRPSLLGRLAWKLAWDLWARRLALPKTWGSEAETGEEKQGE